ncbi:hypothetical protein NDU88_007422 [Pleurodeles waltl]|uniref:Uncharacterized protein n=1 Tax=Pleurodeles waltl TaxID=8319 RepID=A0AAV7N270_PLEWA|nr:hypothetical protein NDU88_007422 [Pleurodeles waltl]
MPRLVQGPGRDGDADPARSRAERRSWQLIIASRYGGTPLRWAVTAGCCGCAPVGGIRRTLLSELHDTEEKLRKAECEEASNSTASNTMITLKQQWGDSETRLRKFDYRHFTARLHA